MADKPRMTTRLRELFTQPQLFVLAGGINPIGAKMAEAAGFEAFYMSGGNTSGQQFGWADSGSSMRDMVDNARKIVLTVNIPVFADADTGYGDALNVYTTVREYIQAGSPASISKTRRFRRNQVRVAGVSRSKRWWGNCGRPWMPKGSLMPNFVIMARCDLGGVPGASFEEIIDRCCAYKAEAGVDVVCPNNLRSWEEITDAIRRIPGPVVPLIPDLRPYPSLAEQQAAGAAAAWFPALTTMAGLQANWDFLHDFHAHGTTALDALREQATPVPGGWPATGGFLTSSTCARWKRATSRNEARAGSRGCSACRGASSAPRCTALVLPSARACWGERRGDHHGPGL